MMQIYNPFLPLNTYIPDGEPHVFGERLYLFGSHDAEGGNTYCPLDYEVWSAPVSNMTEWQCDGTIYHATQDPSYERGGRYEALYAPDVVRGEDGRYYLYYAMAGRGTFTGPIHVAVCDTPAGKYEYYGSVRNADGTDFNRCITFDPGVMNDNGRIWLYYGVALPFAMLRGASEVRLKIWKRFMMPGIERKIFGRTKEQISREPQGIEGANVVELDRDMLTVVSEPSRIVPGMLDAAGTSFEGHAFLEASSIRKIGDVYYFIYSDERNCELCYATSEYPDRGFIYRGVLVNNGDLVRDDRLQKLQTEFNINNHGSLAEINGSWYIFYHRHTHGTTFSRQAMADRIEFMPDGSFQQAEVTSCGLNPGPLKTEGVYPAAITCNIACRKYPLRFRRKSYPYITHHNEKHVITRIKDGTRITYRYFKFDGKTQIVLWLCGSGRGSVTISADETELGRIQVVPSGPWRKYTCVIEAEGTHALVVEFRGKGQLRFWKFAFTT